MLVVLEKQTSAGRFANGQWQVAQHQPPCGVFSHLVLHLILTGAGRLQRRFTLLTTTTVGEPVCAPKMKSRIAERLATSRWKNDQHVSPSHELSDSAGLLPIRPTVLKSLDWFTNNCVDRPLWQICVEPRYKTTSTTTASVMLNGQLRLRNV